ncbi:MAG: IS1595 family transposase [Oligoflexia bacterium]|nr:IS1595 family transposase [Oligoflexia bacterium]
MRIKRTAKVLSAYQFMRKFNTEEKALKFLEDTIWIDGAFCHYCKSKEVSKKNKKTGFRRCRKCRKEFNVRTKTVFHKSKIELSKWLYAVYLLQTARKGVSSLQLSKQIGVTQKTAWFMLHRLREACKNGGGLLSGDVQVDETWFGGLSKNKHKSKLKKEKSWKDSKAMVQGMRAGNKVKTKVIKEASKLELQGNIIDNVKEGSKVMTDEAMHYHTLDKRFIHLTTHHATNQYVNEETGATTSH